MAKDVLIKVEEFIFLISFVVLKTKVVISTENETPIILSQPFLATSNALINYRDGKIKLIFGNMTIKLMTRSTLLLIRWVIFC